MSVVRIWTKLCSVRNGSPKENTCTDSCNFSVERTEFINSVAEPAFQSATVVAEFGCGGAPGNLRWAHEREGKWKEYENKPFPFVVTKR